MNGFQKRLFERPLYQYLRFISLMTALLGITISCGSALNVDLVSFGNEGRRTLDHSRRTLVPALSLLGTNITDDELRTLENQSGRTLIPRDIAPLALQSFQSRSFSAPKATVFNAAFNTLQDLGYGIDYADLPAGFIAASSSSDMIFEEFHNTVITIFIRSYQPDQSIIRINIADYSQTYFADDRNTPKIRIEIYEPPLYQWIFQNISHNLETQGIL